MSPDVVGWAMLAIAIALPATIVFSLGRRFERWQTHRRTRRLMAATPAGLVRLGVAREDAEAGARTLVDVGRRRGA